jgi:catechol 2,3-dioxygenase-like lactoylglutathione lyase family enzyme
MTGGIHHVTAIAGDPQENLDFYTGVLGLHLVKLTVNFDDPETYHLYYGDGQGRPGSILSFFAWPGAVRDRAGSSQVRAVSLSVPEGSSEYWVQRLETHGILFEVRARFGDEVISFSDGDRMRVELVANDDGREPWAGGPVPSEHAVRGLYGVTLAEEIGESTAALLAGSMGFRKTNESGVRTRFEAGGGGPGTIVDLESLPDLPPGRVAVGSIHHVSFRAADNEGQRALRDEIARGGLHVTPVIDREYFRSVYFREPGGVLFEIATDGPGFTADEPAGALGTRLMLPPWLEAQRGHIEETLPALRLPGLVRRAA